LVPLGSPFLVPVMVCVAATVTPRVPLLAWKTLVWPPYAAVTVCPPICRPLVAHAACPEVRDMAVLATPSTEKVTEPVGVEPPPVDTVAVKVAVWPNVGVVVVAATTVVVGDAPTCRVNACVASEPTPLCAVRVSGQAPDEPAGGVPLSVALPSPLSWRLTPLGSAPVLDTAGAG